MQYKTHLKKQYRKFLKVNNWVRIKDTEEWKERCVLMKDLNEHIASEILLAVGWRTEESLKMQITLNLLLHTSGQFQKMCFKPCQTPTQNLV